MSASKRKIAVFLLELTISIFVTIPFGIYWYYFCNTKISAPLSTRETVLVIAVFFLLFIMLGKVYDAFLVSILRISEIIYSQAVAVMVTDGIMFIIISLIMRAIPNIWVAIIAFAFQIFFAILCSTIAHRIYFALFSPKNTAVIYDMRQGMEKIVSEYGLEKKFNIKLTFNVNDCLNNLQLLEGIETVFLSGIHSRDRNVILKYCVENNIDVYVIPRVGDVIMSGAHKMHMLHLPILMIERYNPSPIFLVVKRLMDIIISFIAIIALSPIMLITALAIKISDKGPIFYKQERLTKNGKKFYIHKFRSMRVDAEKDGVARLSSGANDSRVTKVGQFIRKVRIDELPQLFDILSGNLSIVGPRPERPEIAEQYEKEMPEFRLRLQAKAGLTGYAQVYGKYNTTPYDKLQMDLMYIAKPSIIEDLRIIFATVKILFMPESTEGIAEGQTTATN